MDILQIRGENIASLAKPFDIRLDAPPLSGAGLFAITGQTGSGKSSLLDAMCLALYGDCPRLGSAGVNDTVPDVSGETLQSSDARTLLRRGAAQGHATVRFRGRDGAEYEAGWSVRRAYGNASAKLQNVDRSITRLSDGTVLENQIRAVNERIVDLTGLTYDEFRRSVLLAQGDFDSFLGARTAERAAILEKVTGTGLYRDISRRVFAAHGSAERAVQDLDMKLGEHSVLTPEETAAATARIAELDKLRNEAGTALAATRRDIKRHEAIEAATARCTQAAQTLAQARADWSERQEDVAQLGRLRKAAQIRPEHRERQNAMAAEASAQAEISRAAKVETAAEAALSAAAQDLATHRKAHDEVEARFAELGPVWTRATTLDAQISDAAREESAAEAAYEARRAKADEAEAAWTKAKAVLARLEEEAQPWAEALGKEPQGDALVTGWPVLSDRLERRIAASAAAAEAEGRAARFTQELQGAERRKAEIAEATAKAATQSAKIERAVAERAPRRNALRARSPTERLNRLARSAASLQALATLAAQHSAETGHAEAHMRGQEEARKTIAQGEAALTEASRDQSRAEAQIEALEAPAGLAEAALSPEAASLRLHLEEGQPCPVCHALHHPVHEDGAARALAEDLRARLEAARAASRAAVTAREASRARIAQARQDLEALNRRHAEACALLKRIEADYRSAHEGEAGGPIADRLPADPAGAAPALDELSRVLADWKTSLEAELAELEALDRQAQADEAQLTSLARDMRSLRSEEDEIGQQTGPMQRQRDAAQSEAEAQRLAQRNLDARLAQDFGALGLDWTSFDAEGAPHLQELGARKTAHERTLAALQSLTGRSEDARRAIEKTEAQRESVAEAAKALKEAWQDRQAKAEALRAERATLLGGDETAAHRTAFNQRRKELQTAKEAASEAHGTAAAALASAQAANAAARRNGDAASLRESEAEKALSAALDRIGLDAEEARDLLGWDDARIAALEASIGAAKDALLRAERDDQTRQADLAELQKAGVPETPLPELIRQLEQQETEDDARRDERATIQHQLEADRETRARMAELVNQIAKAKAHRDTLAAVNDTVGSASGDRFSTIAQEVTLAILVEQANHHLADIKPRYRLARGLGKLSLHVVDEDMAGEIRSTRSLSGGERFLVSLALALALSTVGGTGTISGTLFIDEGFGTLDAGSLDMAIDALEALQAQGRMIGVISHVQAMQDRIPVQIRIRARGAGASEVMLSAD
ncbi:AAA family ATPase [Roseovarius sp. S4756]|uniref:AAA family ATPase n=1 Tax=Roseovarius maritimus TaxID=3342637 RepID=UPI003728A1D5